MKSFLLLSLIVAFFSFHEVLYRAQLHQANPSMAGAPNGESVLVKAYQQIYGLSDEFATYRSSYWSSSQPFINDTVEVCSESIECLYDSILVYNSLNATMSCNMYAGGPESLNATDSVSVAISQEWSSFLSFRFSLVLFSIQILICSLTLIIFIRTGFKFPKIVVPLSFAIMLISFTLIFFSVINHSVKPYSSESNYIFGIILTILYLIQWMKTLYSIKEKCNNFQFFKINE